MTKTDIVIMIAFTIMLPVFSFFFGAYTYNYTPYCEVNKKDYSQNENVIAEAKKCTDGGMKYAIYHNMLTGSIADVQCTHP